MLGQPREEFLEAADLDLTENSVRVAENVRIKATRTLAQRHGSEYLKTPTMAGRIFEIRPADGVTFALEVNTNQIRALDADAATVWSTAISVLTQEELAYLWVEPFGYQTIIGAPDRMYVLEYAAGTFTLSPFAFDPAPGSELAQPYWAFVSGISLTPSARTGSITVTASSALFSATWVGLRIRYTNREILITAYTSPTQVTGTVQSQLAPTYRLTLSSVAGFQLNDTVIGQTTDFRGLIVGISGLDIDVVTLDFFDGPDVAEKLSAASGTATVSAKVEISPAASPIWDEPLISAVRGYPRSGAAASGRLFLCDFPQAPDVIAASSSRSILDFRVGDEDDDAIARAVGDNRPRFLHVVNAGDLLFFADRGCYLASLRDGNVLSPASFNLIPFDSRGATSARPARVDDGVVFVEAGGSAIAAATLTGDFYSKWKVRTLSTFHDHLFTGPIAVCGPPPNITLEDKYLFVINADGTMVAMSWVDSFDVESVGFVTWTTEGNYLAISPVFGTYWMMVSRAFNNPSVTASVLERMSMTAIMDCQVDTVGALPDIFKGTETHVAGEGWYAGTLTVPTLAYVVPPDTYPADAQIGFNFVSRVQPWPKKLIQHPKAGLLPCRVIRFAASVLATGPVQMRANAITQDFGGYAFGDDLSVPPPAMTKIIRMSVVGRRDHPELEVIKPYPSKMQILAITQEVSL